MSRVRPAEPVHALEIPIAEGALLVPSACIAEVVPMTALVPLPCPPDWVLGVTSWRTRAVAVIAFERLLGGSRRIAAARSKLVVFYPPPGCRPWQFFALLSSADPQPHLLDTAEAVPAGEMADHPCIAAAVHLGTRALAIPDLEALGKVLYP